MRFTRPILRFAWSGRVMPVLAKENEIKIHYVKVFVKNKSNCLAV